VVKITFQRLKVNVYKEDPIPCPCILPLWWTGGGIDYNQSKRRGSVIRKKKRGEMMYVAPPLHHQIKRGKFIGIE